MNRNSFSSVAVRLLALSRGPGLVGVRLDVTSSSAAEPRHLWYMKIMLQTYDVSSMRTVVRVT